MTARSPEEETSSRTTRGVSVGIDVGGTFTDLAAIGDDGRVVTRKVPSTPDDQSEGVIAALVELSMPARDVDRIVHGTTVATNALLERQGARVVLCATDGATDLLELRRQERASLYDLTAHHPPPLVTRENVVAVHERITPQGVLTALDEADARTVAARVAALSPDVVAVSLLHSYGNADHERRLGAAIRDRLPNVEVALSCDVLPEIREYERTATTVAEAYLRPTVASYLRSLGSTLAMHGYPSPGVMTSGGGMRHAEEASRSAASLALSGPAGGVAGAAIIARALQCPLALTIDIGGTSADVGLIVDGQPLAEPGGAVAGVPIALPRVLVETVSAGGGSIAWVDDAGALRVGPRSAGARPGPVAFGRGGTQPTVTDAHVALGNIGASQLAAGVALDAAAATRAVSELARTLDAPLDRVARAIIATADAAMARALRRVSVERGIDPRECVLIAFGGGGPLHGCGLADLLGIRRIAIPPFAGVLSALGLAAAAERREAMTSVMRDAATLDRDSISALLEGLRERAGAGRPQWWGRVRYAGQGHELDVALHPTDDGATITDRFIGVHRARLGFTLDRTVQIVSARVAAEGEARAVSLTSPTHSATLYGPASIPLSDATLFIADRWSAKPSPIGGWMLEKSA